MQGIMHIQSDSITDSTGDEARRVVVFLKRGKGNWSQTNRDAIRRSLQTLDPWTYVRFREARS